MKLSDLPPEFQKQAEKQMQEGARLSVETTTEAFAMANPVFEKLSEEAKKPKYNNQKTENADGEKFDSKLEEKVFNDLVLIHGKENVIRQVSLPLGKKRIRPDFLIILERFDDGSFRCKLFDAKGFATDAWNCKANHFKDKHNIGIELIKK